MGVRAGGVGQVGESGVVGKKGQPEGPGRTITVLGDDYLGRTHVRALSVVDLVAIDEHNQVGVLFNRPGFA